MDRVTKSYFDKFCSNYNLKLGDATSFEHFVHYSLLNSMIDESFDFLDVNIGYNGNLGIDGFAIILNRTLVANIDELKDFIEQHKNIAATVIFVQAKNEKSTSISDIGNFGWAVKDFISEEPKIKWPKLTKEKIKMFGYLIDHAIHLRNKPDIIMYFANVSNTRVESDLETKINDIKNNIAEENIFENVKFYLIGANEIQSKFKKIGQDIQKTFEFEDRVTLPVIQGVKESYLGVVKASIIAHLITDDDGDVLSNIFYDNVRDFQGSNNVNSEIIKTLSSEDKNSFVVFNNGITIVTEEIHITRNKFTIKNFQVINGCQTSHVIMECKDFLDDSVHVPLKLISTDNNDIISKIIRSTNRQTEVKVQDLLAYSTFQKNLEVYYQTYEGDGTLYYERRSKQYDRLNIEKKRIIDKTTQIKSFSSFFLNKPHLATRYFGYLIKEFDNELFLDGHKMIPYYTSSFVLFKLEELFSKDIIDKKYRKLRYFILMLYKFELDKAKYPQLNSNDIEKYCVYIIDKTKDKSFFETSIKNIISKLELLKLDLDDTELSKSNSLVVNCISLYQKRL